MNDDTSNNSDTLYEVLFELSRDALIILNQERVVVNCNQAAVSILGASTKEQLNHSTVIQLSSEIQLNGINSEEASLAAMDMVLTTGGKLIEWNCKRFDGSEFPASVMLTRFEDKSEILILVALRDISEQKALETRLEKTTSFLDTIVNMSPFAMWVSDEKGTLIRSNKALRDKLNVTDEQLLGKYNVLKDDNIKEQGLMPEVQDVFTKHIPANILLPWKKDKAGDVDFEGCRDQYVKASLFPISLRKALFRMWCVSGLILPN